MSNFGSQGTKTYGGTILKDRSSAILGDQFRYGDTTEIQKAVFICVGNDKLLKLAKSIRSSRGPQRSQFSDARLPEGIVKVQRFKDRLFQQPVSPSLSRSTSWTEDLLSADLDNGGFINEVLSHSKLDDLDNLAPEYSEMVEDWPNPDGSLPQSKHKLPRPLSQALTTTARYLSAEKHVPDLLCAVPPALLVLLFCRAISYDALVQVLFNVRQDPLFPLVTFAVGCAVALYLADPATRPERRQFVGDYFILEDPYASRSRLPIVFLNNTKLFEEFLQGRYEHTSINHYISNRLYSFRSRTFPQRSRTIELSILRLHAQRSTEPPVFQMRVVHRASNLRCLNCTNRVFYIISISYECVYCRSIVSMLEDGDPVFHRVNTASFLLPPWQNSPYQARKATRLPILRHVDYDLRWRKALISQKLQRRLKKHEASYFKVTPATVQTTIKAHDDDVVYYEQRRWVKASMNSAASERTCVTTGTHRHHPVR